MNIHSGVSGHKISIMFTGISQLEDRQINLASKLSTKNLGGFAMLNAR